MGMGVMYGKGTYEQDKFDNKALDEDESGEVPAENGTASFTVSLTALWQRIFNRNKGV